jgi:hypothetical protein
MGREEPGDSHPIINEWGGPQMVPWPVEGVPEPEHDPSEMQLLSYIFSKSPELSLTLACLNFPLREKIPKNLFEVVEGLEFAFSSESLS